MPQQRTVNLHAAVGIAKNHDTRAKIRGPGEHFRLGLILAYWKTFWLASIPCFGLVVMSTGLSRTAEQQAIQFTNVTRAAGIQFTHFKGNQGISINLEEFGPGVCVADFDADGWPDIYFVNARDLYDRGIKVQNALYRNNGDGTFTDVTDKAKVPGTGFGLGC